MMKTLARMVCITLSMLMLAQCKFPPPTTSDDQVSKSASAARQLSPEQIALAEKEVKVKALQEDLDRLQGKIDVMGYEIEQLRDQNKKNLSDFDARLTAIESQNTLGAPTSAGHIVAQSITVRAAPTEQANIDSWISDIDNNQNIKPAIAGITQWIEQNPDDQSKKKQALLALAKGHFANNDYPRAIQGFQTVIDEYPKSDQACMARYHQGLSFIKLGDNKNAILFFQETIEICPEHETKKLSEQKIREISQ